MLIKLSMIFNTDEIIDMYFKRNNILVKHQIGSFDNLIDNNSNIFNQYYIELDFKDNIIKNILI